MTQPRHPPIAAEAAEAAEAACLAEIQAALARHGCALLAVPEPVGDQIWTFRVVVQRRAPTDNKEPGWRS